MKKRLEPGMEAPDFSGLDQHGQAISLEDYKGKRLILFFYPKDETPGCTAEACNLNDHYSQLIKLGFEVVGVSPDNVDSHAKFAKNHGLNFSLIADEEKEILNAYGTWGERNLYGRKFMGVARTTFIISPSGEIEKVFRRVKTNEHAQQILTSLGL